MILIINNGLYEYFTDIGFRFISRFHEHQFLKVFVIFVVVSPGILTN